MESHFDSLRRRNNLFCRLTDTDFQVRSHLVVDIFIGKSAQSIRRLPLQ